MIKNVLLVIILWMSILSAVCQTGNSTYKLFPVCFNSQGDEYSPRLINGDIWFLAVSKALDGSTVFDEYSGKPFTDVYIKDSCNRLDAKLPNAFDGQKILISSRFYDGPVCSAQNGNILFFTNNSDPALKGKMGIFGLIKATDTTWTYFDSITFNSNQYNVVHPFFDETSSMLYFSSDMDTTGGRDYDIYKIPFNGNFIGQPQYVSEVNTSANEWFPMFTNGVFNFTSDRSGGMGGMDVYYLKNNQVLNYPEPVNSVSDDYDVFFLGEKNGFISSNRGSSDDIYYMINLSVDEFRALTAQESNAEMNARIFVLGNVISDTSLGIDKSILGSMAAQSFQALTEEMNQLTANEKQIKNDLINNNNKLTQEIITSLLSKENVDYLSVAKVQDEINRLTEEFIANITDPVYAGNIIDSISNVLRQAGVEETYIAQMEAQMRSGLNELKQVSVRKEELNRQLENIAALVINEVKKSDPSRLAELSSLTNTFPDAENKSLDIALLFGKEAVKEYANSFVSNPILFAFDSDDLNQEYCQSLNDFASFVKQFPMFKLFVDGHTDNVGNRVYNIKLSSRRARTVRNYLIRQGVQKSVFVLDAFGQSKPAKPNSTKEGRRANRRVEIRLVASE
jgi:outer membrane protein OmpA-like peptidoglycan-associated protein